MTCVCGIDHKDGWCDYAEMFENISYTEKPKITLLKKIKNKITNTTKGNAK